MHRDPNGGNIHLDPHEQIASGLPEFFSADRAPVIFHDLQVLIQEGVSSRSVIGWSVAIEIKLSTLSIMQRRLGILASEEIVQASLKGMEELDGFVGFLDKE